jgi:hypothetical protein
VPAVNLSQKIKRAELAKKQLDDEIKETTESLNKTNGDIDKERSSGKAVWEMVGIKTVAYRDPFHTGLSKRTPTGERPAINLLTPLRATCHTP